VLECSCTSEYIPLLRSVFPAKNLDSKDSEKRSVEIPGPWQAHADRCYRDEFQDCGRCTRKFGPRRLSPAEKKYPDGIFCVKASARMLMYSQYIPLLRSVFPKKSSSI
jgi:hypothetical protein